MFVIRISQYIQYLQYMVNEYIRILIYQSNIVISTIDPPPNDLLGQVKVRSPSMSLHETPSGTVVGQGMFFLCTVNGDPSV